MKKTTKAHNRTIERERKKTKNNKPNAHANMQRLGGDVPHAGAAAGFSMADLQTGRL